jgi:hypothetical protein
MYETRLVGSGGKAKGMAGLGGATRGPLDYVFNGAIGILLMYLAFTIVEPFWSGAMASGNQVKWEADMKVITEALGRYRLKQGAYDDTDLGALGPYLSEVPEDPWGNPYVIDPVFHRILSAGEDKQFGDDPGIEPGIEPGLDDRIHFYLHPWVLRVVAVQDGAPLPLEVRIDGVEVRPVAGEFPSGTEFILEDAQLRRTIVVAPGPDGSADIAWPAESENSSVNWVAQGPGAEVSPSIHREGAFVYFESARTSPKPQIYRVPFGGGPPDVITEAPDSFEFPEWDGDHRPAIAPASGHLAFHSKRHDDDMYRICLVPKGKVGVPPVVLKPPLPPGTDAGWYQDGKTVTFLSLDRKRIERLPFPPRGRPKSNPIWFEREVKVRGGGLRRRGRGLGAGDPPDRRQGVPRDPPRAERDHARQLDSLRPLRHLSPLCERLQECLRGRPGAFSGEDRKPPPRPLVARAPGGASPPVDSGSLPARRNRLPYSDLALALRWSRRARARAPSGPSGSRR